MRLDVVIVITDKMKDSIVAKDCIEINEAVRKAIDIVHMDSNVVTV